MLCTMFQTFPHFLKHARKAISFRKRPYFSRNLVSNKIIRESSGFTNEQFGAFKFSYLSTALIIAAGATNVFHLAFAEEQNDEEGDSFVISNWSGTHVVSTKRYLQPETLEELERVVADAHKHGKPLRPVGSALSPNGIGLSSTGMVSLGLMDKILQVDPVLQTVTVQAGARVSQVVEALRPYGLTLQNYASIAEQQIGGFVQVSAHGTGATIPPVDEQVIGMKVVTPAKGTIILTAKDSDPSAFYMARVGLGCLGVVAEVTLQCVPAHQLTEHTFVVSRDYVERNHARLLRENRHVRYMWIPYTDVVVVVCCNPPASLDSCELHKIYEPEDQVQPMKTLLRELQPNINEASLQGMTFSQLRDCLLAVSPLDQKTVIRINQAEAEFWKRAQGYRTDWSDKILGFDCGGQQWVAEVAFPCGTLENPSFADIAYMEELLTMIEILKIPAPAPIEQRWTASSRSPMSPAFSDDQSTLHSWVGIIMYLPTDDESTREQITNAFSNYVRNCDKALWERYNAVLHWAKIESPERECANDVQDRLRKRYALQDFNALRKAYDPKLILENNFLKNIISPSHSSNDKQAALKKEM